MLQILHGHLASTPDKFGLFLADRRSRGHSLKLKIEPSRVNVRKYYFSNRIAAPWNALPESVVQASSVRVFKNELKNINLNEFLLINI